MTDERTTSSPATVLVLPLMVGPDRAAALIDVSTRSWQRMVSAQATPAPTAHFGNLPRWSVDDLHHWVELGCPGRERFEAAVSTEAQLGGGDGHLGEGDLDRAGSKGRRTSGSCDVQDP